MCLSFCVSLQFSFMLFTGLVYLFMIHSFFSLVLVFDLSFFVLLSFASLMQSLYRLYRNKGKKLADSKAMGHRLKGDYIQKPLMIIFNSFKLFQ